MGKRIWARHSSPPKRPVVRFNGSWEDVQVRTVTEQIQLGPVLGIFSEPQDDGGDDQGGAKVGGSFGVAGGQGPELLEAGEAAFDDVASGVDVLVERRWPAAGGAFALPPGDLVGLLRAGEGDS